MKKRILVLSIAVIGTIGFNISMENTNLVDKFCFESVEALASSEKGCVSRTGENNGDCTTDGTRFFCENSRWIHDCVKGAYPN